MTITLNALPSRPFVLALGDTADPTSVPGIPTVQVGGAALFVLAAATNGSGTYTLPLTVPPSPLTGTYWYWQALTLDAANGLITSNPFVSLFTQ